MLVAEFCLKDRVDDTHNMPDTYTTVVARVQLAQQFCDHAREQTRACENLVHDQHLQQQGASEKNKIVLAIICVTKYTYIFRISARILHAK
jgi:hypothetical protein